jgi:sRNA-binding protein
VATWGVRRGKFWGMELPAALAAGPLGFVGVLTIWKMSTTYCRAVLNRDQRITLDGAPVEAVDEEAKDLATKQLMRLALWERRKADLARQGEA